MNAAMPHTVSSQENILLLARLKAAQNCEIVKKCNPAWPIFDHTIGTTVVMVSQLKCSTPF